MIIPLYFTIHNVNDRTIFRPTIDISTWVAIITCRLTYYYTVWNLSRNAFVHVFAVFVYGYVCVYVPTRMYWFGWKRERERERFCLLVHTIRSVQYPFSQLCALLNVDFAMNCLQATHMFVWQRVSVLNAWQFTFLSGKPRTVWLCFRCALCCCSLSFFTRERENFASILPYRLYGKLFCRLWFSCTECTNFQEHLNHVP